MIFVLIAVAALTIVRYARVIRRERSFRPLREIGFSVLAGLLAGVLLGIAARAGMAAITIANGSAPRITWGGTLQVIGTFVGIGGTLGIGYAGLFRQRLDRCGVAFASLLTITTAFPLLHAAGQLLATAMPYRTLVTIAAFALVVLWFPYAMTLELIVARFMRR